VIPSLNEGRTFIVEADEKKGISPAEPVAEVDRRHFPQAHLLSTVGAERFGHLEHSFKDLLSGFKSHSLSSLSRNKEVFRSTIYLR
jgi:hypothetical protein